MDSERQIRAYLVENFLLGEENGLTNTESLLGAGIIDSTGVLEIVGFIEKTFKIDVSDEDMVPENLDTIRSIAAFVQRKSAGQTARPE